MKQNTGLDGHLDWEEMVEKGWKVRNNGSLEVSVLRW